MATSRTDAVIDALITKFTAAAGLSAAQIVDGPLAEGLRHDEDTVFVGWDGDQDDSGRSGGSTQQWVGVGTNSRRDELVEVTCAVIARIGDADMAARRTRCYELVDACEAAILADHTLGVGSPGAPGSARNAYVSSTELRQTNNAGGVVARVVFTVTCICRL